MSKNQSKQTGLLYLNRKNTHRKSIQLQFIAKKKFNAKYTIQLRFIAKRRKIKIISKNR